VYSLIKRSGSGLAPERTWSCTSTANDGGHTAFLDIKAAHTFALSLKILKELFGRALRVKGFFVFKVAKRK
jgi:hypothetical protein